MKILIITEGFFPGNKYGGPPVSIDNFCSLMDEYDCYIVTHDHDLGEKARYDHIDCGWNNRGNCKVLYLSDGEYRADVFERVVQEIRPDILYLQSLFQRCVFPCLRLARKYRIKTLLAPRGELCEGAFRKKYKKLPYIATLRMLALLKSVYYQSTSEEETQAIRKYLGCKISRIFRLSNIPSIPKAGLVHPYKKTGEARFVFLSRIHPKKNLLYAIKLLRAVKGKVIFHIYGSIEDQGYWDLCLNEIRTLPENVTVQYCGLVSHDEVHSVFSQYDAFIFPTFSENYGHVIIEALLSGCPVILSDRTPWNDLEMNGAGYVCALDDVTAFENAIQKVINRADTEYRGKAIAYANKCLDLNTIRGEYSRVLCSVKNNIAD